jgi:hypothetical protein
LFLAIAAIPVTGPLIVYFRQAMRTHRARSKRKETPFDDLADSNFKRDNPSDWRQLL